MKPFEVWAEGYLATGMEGVPAKAVFVGIFEGENFNDACRKFADSERESERFQVIDGNPYFFVRLFDNETDARKSFG